MKTRIMIRVALFMAVMFSLASATELPYGTRVTVRLGVSRREPRPHALRQKWTNFRGNRGERHRGEWKDRSEGRISGEG